MSTQTIVSLDFPQAEKIGGARPPLQRMHVIWALVRSGTFPNATQLARYLETSTKSIHRDIEFMRDRLLFDIRYDGSRWGYTTTLGPRRCPFCDYKLAARLKDESGEALSVYGEDQYKRRVPELLDEDHR